jgi:hypothetical protein
MGLATAFPVIGASARTVAFFINGGPTGLSAEAFRRLLRLFTEKCLLQYKLAGFSRDRRPPGSFDLASLSCSETPGDLQFAEQKRNYRTF